ncbi:MAG: signal peptidase II [candidate division KSB1 bacterium]
MTALWLRLQGMGVLMISVIILALDQITKFAVTERFFPGESLIIWGDLLRFTHVQNSGIAFGISFGGKYFLTVFATIASAVILYYLYLLRAERLRTRLALALIFGGAIGNLLDRYVQGAVTDFIDFDFIDVHIAAFNFHMERWPVFNVADSAVTIGMLMLVFFVLFEREPMPAEAVSEATPFLQTKPAPSDESDNWREARDR